MESHLVLLYEVVHVNSDIVLATMALSGPLAIVNPPRGGKIGGLCTIEASVEARVVGIGKCDDEITSLLQNLKQINVTS